MELDSVTRRNSTEREYSAGQRRPESSPESYTHLHSKGGIQISTRDRDTNSSGSVQYNIVATVLRSSVDAMDDHTMNGASTLRLND